MSRFFISERDSLINDVIEGVILSTPHHNLARLDVDPAIRVVVRNDWQKDRVALISGGGSGHEPAHAGFVGKGMLTAAVCGDLFASPSVDAVLHAIVAVTGKAGCLLIVKNYTGDRLNFGLAAEKAKQLGYQVELVMVADDIALPDNKQPRGIAGTALVHKIAGYAAEQGQSLAQVADAARQANKATASIGVAMASCHLPGEPASNQRIQPGQVELGLGIHGEPGISHLETQNSQQIIGTLVEKLLPYRQAGARLAVLINNLGGVSPLEMYQLTKELAHSALGEAIDYLIGPAAVVSALDMKGFSLSIINLNAQHQEALLAPVATAGWQPLVKLGAAPRQAMQPISQRPAVQPSEQPQVGQAVAILTQSLIDQRQELNRLDALVGDGDTGTTFAAGAQAILDLHQSKKLPLQDLAALFALVGERLATVMGGSSGVLMSIFFTAAGQQVAEKQPLAQALNFGLQQMKHYGGADIGDRTLIDALQPALKALADGGDLAAIAAAARKGADSTAQMQKANAGRSSYLNSQSLQNVIDPGAEAIATMLAAYSSKA